MSLTRAYWEDRYKKNELGWDIGYISPPLQAYIDQLSTKNLKILVPGAGNGYEVIYLYQKGFLNTFVVDLAKQPLNHIKSELPDIHNNHLIHGDFFDLSVDSFDLILEQTFFCALHPNLREAYVDKMFNILRPGGKIAGLLFDFPLTESGPPFGGSREEYSTRFGKKFKIKKLEEAYNSIPPRKGKELFFIFEK